jgi:hypothetical protein
VVAFRLLRHEWRPADIEVRLRGRPPAAFRLA